MAQGLDSGPVGRAGRSSRFGARDTMGSFSPGMLFHATRLLPAVAVMTALAALAGTAQKAAGQGGGESVHKYMQGRRRHTPPAPGGGRALIPRAPAGGPAPI